MPHIANDNSCDLLVTGGGIFGLWAARHAIQAGKKVILCEKREVGSGASGGFLGALMPHMPDDWKSKKQMQFEALVSLGSIIDELEDETGISCGYKMCGRIMPLPHEKMVGHMRSRIEGAEQNWVTGSGERFHMSHLDEVPPEIAPTNWLNPEFAAHGVSHDTFSARINPRAYLKALASHVSRHATLLENTALDDFDLTKGVATLSGGQTISFGQICITCGYEGYDLLQPFLGPLNNDRPIGRGVKGQAVLVDFDHDDDLPIVYHDRVYVIPQPNGRVAIGSTSHNDWSGAPDFFDPDDLDFYTNALKLVPALKNAPIVEKWAAVRPRNTLAAPWEVSSATEPYVGKVPGFDTLLIGIGGFKISFGIAHSILKKVIAE